MSLFHRSIPLKNHSLVRLIPQLSVLMLAVLLVTAPPLRQIRGEDDDVPENSSAEVAESEDTERDPGDGESTEAATAESGDSEEMESEVQESGNEMVQLLRRIEVGLQGDSIDRDELRNLINQAIDMAVQFERDQIREANDAAHQEKIGNAISEVENITNKNDYLADLQHLVDDTQSEMVNRLYQNNIANEVRQILHQSKRELRTVLRELSHQSEIQSAMLAANLEQQVVTALDQFHPHVTISEQLGMAEQKMADALTQLDVGVLQRDLDRLCDIVTEALSSDDLKEGNRLPDGVMQQCEEVQAVLLDGVSDIKRSLEEADITESTKTALTNYIQSVQQTLRESEIESKIGNVVEGARSEFLRKFAADPANSEDATNADEIEERRIAIEEDWNHALDSLPRIKEILMQTDDQLNQIIENSVSTISFSELTDDMFGRLEEAHDQLRITDELTPYLNELLDQLIHRDE